MNKPHICLNKNCLICDNRCPNYYKESKLYCDRCGEMILPGEEYIENIYGDVSHLDCCYGMKDVLKWIGWDIKMIDD